MANDIPHEQLLKEAAQVLKRFEEAGNLAPIENHDDWDTLVESQPTEQPELLQELVLFSDLWRYLQERNENLGQDIVDAISHVHRLTISQRISELSTINKKLMERIGDSHQRTQVRTS